jgi:hypothetical protein
MGIELVVGILVVVACVWGVAELVIMLLGIERNL